MAITFYDYVARTFIDHTPYSLASVAGSVVFLVLFVMVGIWGGLSQWNKRPDVAAK